jgi:hypothetical protein
MLIAVCILTPFAVSWRSSVHSIESYGNATAIPNVSSSEENNIDQVKNVFFLILMDRKQRMSEFDEPGSPFMVRQE